MRKKNNKFTNTTIFEDLKKNFESNKNKNVKLVLGLVFLIIGIISIFRVAGYTENIVGSLSGNPVNYKGNYEGRLEYDSEVVDNSIPTINIGVSTEIQEEILMMIEQDIVDAGYVYNIIKYDYFDQGNVQLQNGKYDALFVHDSGYIELNEAENMVKQIQITHFDGLKLFSSDLANLSKIRKGSVIAIPRDEVDSKRALLLLEEAGLIEFRASGTVSILNMAKNDYDLRFQEMDYEYMVEALKSVDLICIPSYYAMIGGLEIENTLLEEKATSETVNSYADMIVVTPNNSKSEKTLLIQQALKKVDIKSYINNKCNGWIVPIF